MRPPPSVRAVLLALAMGSGACGWFDDPSPDEARLVVESDAATPVRVVVSLRFVAGETEVGDTQVEVFQADTFDVTPPFDRTFGIREEQRFFAEVSRLEEDGRVRVRVYLDGDERFNDTGGLAEEGPFRFVFLFNQIVSRNIEVL